MLKEAGEKENHPLVLTFEDGCGGSCTVTLSPWECKGLFRLSGPFDTDLFGKKKKTYF